MPSSFRRVASTTVAALLISSTASTRAAPHELTLRDVRAQTRARAPRLLAARAAVGLARAEVSGASRLARRNPQLLVAAGPRMRGGDAALDVNVRLIQQLEVTGQRGARIARAEAGVALSRAEAAERTRRLVATASRVFLRARHADLALAVARADLRLTSELVRVARARQGAGEAGLLDVNVAIVTRARAQARVGSLTARRRRLLGLLRGILGLDAAAKVKLKGPLVRPMRFTLGALRAKGLRRPDLRLLTAQAKRARAERRLARAQRWPGIGLFARYGREESANIVLGGIIFTLPVFSHGQRARARGAARAALAERRRRALVLRLGAELAGQLGAYRKLRATLARFRKQALGRLSQSLDLARKSYQAGSSTLANLIVLRRELVGARVTHLELKLQVALAAVALEAAAGDDQ